MIKEKNKNIFNPYQKRKDVIIYKEENDTDSPFKEGMTIDEISDIFSDRLIKIIKDQLENNKDEIKENI